MNKIFRQTIFLIVLTLLGCGRGRQTVNHIQHLGDTPYQEDSILLTYGTNPERALVMLDSALAFGNIDEYNEKIIRATIYSKSLIEQRQDSAVLICQKLLTHDSVKNNADNKDAVLNVLINASRVRGDYNDYLKWSVAKASLCREQDEEVELLRTEAEIGMVLTHLGRIDDGLKKLDECISQLDKPGSVDRMDAFVVASKRKITVLQELGCYSESIPVAKAIIARLNHYEHHAKDYVEDSYRLSWSDNPTDREKYIDFSKAQADAFMAIAYSRIGQKDEAKTHLTAFDQSDYGHTFSARRMIIPAQVALGMYDEALATGDKMIEGLGPDTINILYINMLRYKAIAAQAKGQKDAAYQLMSRHANLSKILNDSLHRSEAHDYAARYHAKEQELKIQKSESESHQKTIVLISISVLLIIMIVATFYFIRQNKRITKKNRALVRMINESKHLALETDTTEPEHNDDEAEEEVSEDRTANDGNEVGITSFDIADFEAIDSVIRSERLYKNPSLQRQDICQRFGITRFTLNNMLYQVRGNASVPQYINAIRMEEAVKLIRENPEMPFTVVAENVGFSAANFRRHFINNFGMTPLEYRQNQ